MIHGNPNSKNFIVKYEIGTQTYVVVEKHIFYYNDLSELKLPKEYRADVHYSDNFKALCALLSVEEVISLERIEQFVEILTNGILRISQGSIVNWIKELSKKSRAVIKELKIELKNGKMIYTDLTETKENKEKRYVRNYSTNKITLYIPSKDKKIKRVKRHWILDGYTGYVVQDHDTGLYNYGIREKHVECNVHLRRYLKGNLENTKHEWSTELDKLLLEIKAEKEKRIEHRIESFDEEELKEYSKRYDEIIKKGYKENREDEKLKDKKITKRDEKTLLNRLKKFKANHLIFAYDFSVPFDNNLSERDLRTIKLKKKVSGGHRSYKGLKCYCNIRTIISTCKKQGLNILDELINIFKGKPSTITV